MSRGRAGKRPGRSRSSVLNGLFALGVAHMDRQAFTLLEVTVSLALVGLALAGILSARAMLTRSAARAQRVAQANVLAGRLVCQWQRGEVASTVGEPCHGRDEAAGLAWTLLSEPREACPGVFLNCLEVKIHDGSAGSDAGSIVSFEAWMPLGGSPGHDPG